MAQSQRFISFEEALARAGIETFSTAYSRKVMPFETAYAAYLAGPRRTAAPQPRPTARPERGEEVSPGELARLGERFSRLAEWRLRALREDLRDIVEQVVSELADALRPVLGEAAEGYLKYITVLVLEKAAPLLRTLPRDYVREYVRKIVQAVVAGLVKTRLPLGRELGRVLLAVAARVGRSVEKVAERGVKSAEEALKEAEKIVQELTHGVAEAVNKAYYEEIVRVLKEKLRHLGKIGEKIADALSKYLAHELEHVRQLVGEEGASEYLKALLGALRAVEIPAWLPPELLREFLKKFMEGVVKPIRTRIESAVSEAESALEDLSRWAEERLSKLPQDYRKVYEEIYSRLCKQLGRLGKLGQLAARAVAALTAVAIAEAAREVGLEAARQQIEPIAEAIAGQILALGVITPEAVADIVRQLKEKVLAGTERKLSSILENVRKRLEELRKLALEYATESELESKLASEIYSTIYSSLGVGGAAREAIARALTGAIVSYYDEFRRLVGAEGAEQLIREVAQRVAERLRELRTVPLSNIDEFVEEFRRSIIEQIVSYYRNVYAKAESALQELEQWARSRMSEEYSSLYKSLADELRRRFEKFGLLGRRVADALAALGVAIAKAESAVLSREAAAEEARRVVEQIASELQKALAVSPAAVADFVEKLRQNVLSRAEQEVKKAVEEVLEAFRQSGYESSVDIGEVIHRLEEVVEEAHRRYEEMRRRDQRLIRGSEIVELAERAAKILRQLSMFGIEVRKWRDHEGRVHIEVYIPWANVKVELCNHKPNTNYYYIVGYPFERLWRALERVAEVFSVVKAVAEKLRAGGLNRKIAYLLATTLAPAFLKYSRFLSPDRLAVLAENIAGQLRAGSLGHVLLLARALSSDLPRKIEAVVVGNILAEVARELYSLYRRAGSYVRGEDVLRHLREAVDVLRLFGLEVQRYEDWAGRVHYRVKLPTGETVTLGGFYPWWDYGKQAALSQAERLVEIANKIVQHYLQTKTATTQKTTVTA